MTSISAAIAALVAAIVAVSVHPKHRSHSPLSSSFKVALWVVVGADLIGWIAFVIRK
jgi:hypothetical protein